MSTFGYVFAALLIIEGLFSVISGNTIGSARNSEKIAQKYDMNSYRKFNRIFGGASLFMGLVFLVEGLSSDKVLPFEFPIWLLLVAFGIVVVVCVLAMIFVLKKKGKSGKAEENSSNDKFIDED